MKNQLLHVCGIFSITFVIQYTDKDLGPELADGVTICVVLLSTALYRKYSGGSQVR